VLARSIPTRSRDGPSGATYWNQGRWEGGRGAAGAGDGDEKRVLGEEHPDSHTRMAHLAVMYSNQAGGRSRGTEGAVIQTRSGLLARRSPTSLTSMATSRDVRKPEAGEGGQGTGGGWQWGRGKRVLLLFISCLQLGHALISYITITYSAVLCTILCPLVQPLHCLHWAWPGVCNAL